MPVLALSNRSGFVVGGRALCATPLSGIGHPRRSPSLFGSCSRRSDSESPNEDSSD